MWFYPACKKAKKLKPKLNPAVQTVNITEQNGEEDYHNTTMKCIRAAMNRYFRQKRCWHYLMLLIYQSKWDGQGIAMQRQEGRAWWNQKQESYFRWKLQKKWVIISQETCMRMQNQITGNSIFQHYLLHRWMRTWKSYIHDQGYIQNCKRSRQKKDSSNEARIYKQKGTNITCSLVKIV